MPPLFPPEYPDRPDMPLLAFGPSFAEEISRSVIAAIWQMNDEPPHESEVRIAAALTMLEAFHPRDHLECMLAAQGVASHAAIMECHRRAMHPDTEEPIAIKLRANVAQLSRTFSTLMHDMERRQAKPLMQRPTPPPPPPPPEPGQDTPPGPPPAPAGRESDEPDDARTRPDGSPASLDAYAPKPPKQVFIPREPAIMRALALRPKPWRIVNHPPAAEPPAPPPAPPPEPTLTRGPLDFPEAPFSGDAIMRFASARFDPDAPPPPVPLDVDEAVIELELISTGGDPEAEAERQALIAAHPEGRPVKVLRYGRKKPDG